MRKDGVAEWVVEAALQEATTGTRHKSERELQAARIELRDIGNLLLHFSREVRWAHKERGGAKKGRGDAKRDFGNLCALAFGCL